MKLFNFPRVTIALAIATTAAITGCGNNQAGVVGIPGQGVGGIGPGGCVPVTQPIAFTGTNIPVDPYTQTFNAGLIPLSQQPFGSLVIGGNPIQGGPIQGSGVDGMISLAINSAPMQQPQYPGAYPGSYPGSGYGASGPLNLTGSLSISPIQQQQIMTAFGSGAYGSPYGQPYSPYPTYPGAMPQPGMPTTGQQVCVSGIAIGQGHVYSSGIPNFGATVYLYMNGTQHGYTLHFY